MHKTAKSRQKKTQYQELFFLQKYKKIISNRGKKQLILRLCGSPYLRRHLQAKEDLDTPGDLRVLPDKEGQRAAVEREAKVHYSASTLQGGTNINMQCSAVHCSAVYSSAEQCSAVQCSAAQCNEVQCSAVQCSAVQPG